MGPGKCLVTLISHGLDVVSKKEVANGDKKTHDKNIQGRQHPCREAILLSERYH